MLPPFIIEQIRQREERERARREDQRPCLELPIERMPAPRRAPDDEDDPDRGVIVIELV